MGTRSCILGGIGLGPRTLSLKMLLDVLFVVVTMLGLVSHASGQKLLSIGQLFSSGQCTGGSGGSSVLQICNFTGTLGLDTPLGYAPLEIRQSLTLIGNVAGGSRIKLTPSQPLVVTSGAVLTLIGCTIDWGQVFLKVKSMDASSHPMHLGLQGINVNPGSALVIQDSRVVLSNCADWDMIARGICRTTEGPLFPGSATVTPGGILVPWYEHGGVIWSNVFLPQPTASSSLSTQNLSPGSPPRTPPPVSPPLFPPYYPPSSPPSPRSNSPNSRKENNDDRSWRDKNNNDSWGSNNRRSLLDGGDGADDDDDLVYETLPAATCEPALGNSTCILRAVSQDPSVSPAEGGRRVLAAINDILRTTGKESNCHVTIAVNGPVSFAPFTSSVSGGGGTDPAASSAASAPSVAVPVLLVDFDLVIVGGLRGTPASPASPYFEFDLGSVTDVIAFTPSGTLTLRSLTLVNLPTEPKQYPNGLFTSLPWFVDFPLVPPSPAEAAAGGAGEVVSINSTIISITAIALNATEASFPTPFPIPGYYLSMSNVVLVVPDDEFAYLQV